MANDVPAVSSIPVSNYYASTSGAVPVSGNTLSADGGQLLISANILSGDWYVERQTLKFDYARVPMFLANGTHTLNLSANYLASGTINGTGVVGIMDASYSRKKVSGAYYTQTYRQTQKFEIHGLSAAGGVAYGAGGVGGLSAGQLGPQGSVETYQPWYYRRPWNQSADTEVNKQVRVANVAYATSAGGRMNWTHHQQYYYQNYEAHFVPPMAQYCPRRQEDPWAQHFRPYYYLGGGYSVAKETSRTMIYGILDQIGNELSLEKLAVVPPTGNGSSGFTYLQGVDLSGIPEYDINRHDYS